MLEEAIIAVVGAPLLYGFMKLLNKISGESSSSGSSGGSSHRSEPYEAPEDDYNEGSYHTDDELDERDAESLAIGMMMAETIRRKNSQ